MTGLADLRTAHTRALARTAEAVAAVRPDDLELPTPCTGWSLRRLLEHVVGQNHGFAAAARGHGADLSVWADRPIGTDPAVAFAHSAAELTEAFAAAEPEAVLALPEIRTGGAFQLRQAIAFHFLDTLVHGWDVAAALGLPYRCEPADAELLLAIANRVPTPRPPGGAFRPVLDTAADGPFDRALACLGRDPGWRPPA